jgi:beta-alanine degradation protein BauB
MNPDSNAVGRVFLLVVAASLMWIARVEAQDVAKVSPETVKVILENDKVRIIESTIPPGVVQAKHSHPTTIVYYLSAATVKSEGPDGRPVVTERRAGEVAYREPLTHSSENVGKTPARTLVIELKSVSSP